MNVQRAPRKLQGPTHQQRELHTTRQLCDHLKQLADLQRSEAISRRDQDYVNLKTMTEKSKRDDEIALLRMEASMGIINIGLRKQSLQPRFVSRASDEKELNNMMQTHKDEFTQFIWKRRLQSRGDLRLLFQSGSGMIGRFGELVSGSSLEAIQSFDRGNWVKLCKEAISSGLCDHDDVPGFFSNKITISTINIDPQIHIFPNRLEFQILEANATLKNLERWYTVYGTCGPWAIKLYSKPLVHDLVIQALEQVMHISKNADSYSYINILARTLELVHPTHQLQATVLAFPLYGIQILKRRILSLGYYLGNTNEESMVLDHKLIIDILKQIHLRLEKEHRYYFEWTVSPKTKWRIDNNTYPGKDSFGFGFGYDGLIFMDGESIRYVIDIAQSISLSGIRTWGLVIDFHHGAIHLVIDGKIEPPAFGRNASAFDANEQKRQRHLILTNQLIPMFSVQVGVGVEERPHIKLNFGDHPFNYNINATSMNTLIQPLSTKGIDMISILDTTGPNANRERLSQDEDEKFHTSLEKTYFRVSLLPDSAKSFSQFPPSVYRRSLATTRIQRAWRRFKGKKMRERVKKEQYAAAIIIQRIVRRKLREIREIKNQSAGKIQRFWRHKRFIWIALLRCVYQQPIAELHRAATVIQRKWRHWHMFKNSPLASKYQMKIEVLQKAANTIIWWWRPLYARMTEISEARRRTKAATNIQRVYRGYALRKLLRPELRQKLSNIGAAVAKARHSLLEIQSTYVLQRAWRRVLQHRVQIGKTTARNKAAMRVQSLWRGYWVRSHTPLRFTYGEAVFLMAVCKALRHSHFILKMYKPCGIVCPKPDLLFNRDHR
ncbi:hypothetical protein BASA81_009022 [Batrachochytrium salamandrivorans]|nr:hypothetical protein BASA81_009022 [Batrachochytrium salamandrivorans]